MEISRGLRSAGTCGRGLRVGEGRVRSPLTFHVFASLCHGLVKSVHVESAHSVVCVTASEYRPRPQQTYPVWALPNPADICFTPSTPVSVCVSLSVSPSLSLSLYTSIPPQLLTIYYNSHTCTMYVCQERPPCWCVSICIYVMHMYLYVSRNMCICLCIYM